MSEGDKQAEQRDVADDRAEGLRCIYCEVVLLTNPEIASGMCADPEACARRMAEEVLRSEQNDLS